MKNKAEAGKVKVWDGFVRTFHWSLLASFAIAYVTSQSGMQVAHTYIGYLIAALLLSRLVWGFVGSDYARFSNFFYSPAVVLKYLHSMFAGRPSHYLGHNPAGGVMVFAILVALLLMVVSGFVLEATIEYEGLFVSMLSGLEDDTVYFWRDVHEVVMDLFWFLIAAHMAGVILASWQHKENLVRAMITGYKNQTV